MGFGKGEQTWLKGLSLKILFLCLYFYWLVFHICVFLIGNNNSDKEKVQKFSNHEVNFKFLKQSAEQAINFLRSKCY